MIDDGASTRGTACGGLRSGGRPGDARLRRRALADDDSVRVGAASSFAAGGSAQGVNVAVRKRTEGCVLLRTVLVLSLEGLQPSQAKVEVNAGGQWFPVALTGGGGNVGTAQTSPLKPTLCKGKGITVRYRVTFGADPRAAGSVVTGAGVSAAGQEVAGAATRPG